MKIRKAQLTELSVIEAIYSRARSFMEKTGNPTQWGKIYPQKETIIADIENGNLYCIVAEEMEAVFAFIEGPDPTYNKIDGEWINSLPYCAVHRVASAGRTRGILKMIMDYCFEKCDNIKIDTHENNIVMQGALSKYGFRKCGIIHLENGEPRIAYQMGKK